MKALSVMMGIAVLAAPARAGVVTERWGAGGRCRHAGTVSFQDVAGGVAVVKFDLSKLPKGAKVYRARLLLRLSAGPGPLAKPVRIAPMLSAYSPSGGWAVGDPLSLAGPRFRSFDATGIVRKWASGKLSNHGLQVAGAPGWKRSSTCLEVSYDGKLTAPPPPATGLEAFHRAGQVFLTWKEVRCPFAGKDEVPWDEMKAHRKALSAGKLPQVSYRI